MTVWRRAVALALCMAVMTAGAIAAGVDEIRVQGYGEGDYLRIASPEGGTLTALSVEEGDQVSSGAPLFALDDVRAQAQLAQAQADLAQAEALLANMRKGKRPDELKSIAERKAQAEASLRYSEATLARQTALAKNDFASRSRLDEAEASAKRDRALVQELSAEYRTATLGARDDEIAAQEALTATRRAAVVSAQKTVSDLAPKAPKAGVIDRVYYRPGEVVPAGHPVLSLLPPENVKLVFFVPEAQFSRLKAGQKITFSCDGCQPRDAVITFLASQAEYTPPVIYSVESRQKLVYRIEARGVAGAPLGVHPGQPVDVMIGVGR